MSSTSIAVAESSANRRKQQYDDVWNWCVGAFATQPTFDDNVSRIITRVIAGFYVGDRKVVAKYNYMIIRRRESGDKSAYSRDEKALADERCRIVRRAKYIVSKLHEDMWGDYAVKPIMLKGRTRPFQTPMKY
jgi:hypothetical protein